MIAISTKKVFAIVGNNIRSILVKEDKDTLYNNLILKCYLSGKVLTVAQVADNVGLSEKTVRTRLNQLNYWLVQKDLGYIAKKQGIGSWLKQTEKQKRRLIELVFSQDNQLSMTYQLDDRSKLLMKRLLKIPSGELTTLKQIADELYLSAPTAGVLLKKVSKWFEQHNLKIISLRSRGISLSGNEYDFRTAICDYIMDARMEISQALSKEFALGVDVEKIRMIIKDAEIVWKIKLTDYSFQIVWILTCLSMARRKNVKKGSFKIHEDNIQNYNEYSFAVAIYQMIGQRFRIKILEDDVNYLAVIFLTAKKMRNYPEIRDGNNASQYDSEMHKFVKLIIHTIDTVVDADLSNDEILYDSLLMHLRAAIFRMKYSIVLEDNISTYVKNDYKQTFLATWSTSNLFEEYYGVQVTEGELAEIALYIQASIIRQKTEPLSKVLLINDKGMSIGQLIAENIKYNIPEIQCISVVSYHEFKSIRHSDAEIIINTSKFEIKDQREVAISDRLTKQGIEDIRHKVYKMFCAKNWKEKHFDHICHQLFSADLFLTGLELTDKNELLTKMVQKLEDKGNVTSDYLKSVLERECATTTCIGGGVAIPHGKATEVNESKVVVAILKKPIEWHDDLVDVVFLLALKMNSNFETNRSMQFYKDFVRMTESSETVDALKKMNSALEIYEYFIK